MAEAGEETSLIPEREMGTPEDAASDQTTGEEVDRRWWHVNRTFLPIKVAYFLYFAGAVAVLPLLTLQMTDLGLTLEDVAQVYIFLPVISFIGPPVTGFIADRTGRITEVYIVCIILNAGLHHALYFVPVSHHTTAEALKQNVSTSNIPCTAWPPPVCDNLTRGHRCRVTCPEATPPVLSVCTAAEVASCLEQGQRWSGEALEIHLPLNSTGCVGTSHLLVNGTVKTELSDPGQVTCPAECHMTCDPTNDQLISNRRTFWTYFVLRICSNFFLASSFTLLDATNLAIVKENKMAGQNFGRQRVTGIAASVIVPPLTGWIIDSVSGTHHLDYTPAFCILDICTVLVIIALILFKLRIALPERAHISQAAKLLKRPEVLVFILVVAVLGSLWGFLEAFLFVFLKQLDAPTYLLGLTMTVAGLASIPFNWYSEEICKRCGHVNMLIVAFFGYAVRYIGYSYIRNPWLCFPFELLEVVTTHLMWNSAATYAGQLAPSGLLATLTGMAGALHYSFGRGVGSFVGGYLMALFGSAVTYRIMGVVGAVGGVLYMTVYYCCLRHHISGRESRRQAKEKQAAMTQHHNHDEEMTAMLNGRLDKTAI